jgi:diguanylate cyclase (GGDEF)-like protein/PAS domain S-box-containing protein
MSDTRPPAVAVRSLRTLVVEDSENDALLLLRQLKKGGYEPLFVRVETREEMSRRLDERQWDLVIADYSLPQFNAMQALELMQQKQLDIPFIVVSGTIGEATAVEAMRAGAHDYIMKGNVARLLPAIERELREWGERAARRKNERRFRSLIENSSDIITVVDPAGLILYESPSVERLLGHAPGDLIGTLLTAHVHPEDAAALVEALATQSTPSVEFRFATRDREWRHLEATVKALIHDPDVGGIVLNCRDITARKQDEAMIRHLAYFDALTGLPNRMLFDDRLSQALAHSRRRGEPGLAIMFIDLDRFKTINDTLGHGAGDLLLRITAERFSGAIREEDTVARLGGDEFLILLPGVADVESAARVAQKILATFSAPFSIADQELHATTSIGISIFPGDGDDPETLIRNADTALYRAKEGGRNRYQLYAPAMNAIAFQRLVLENSLRRAAERNELALHYQPLVSLATGAVVSVEALIRWHHPELGLVSPAEFIPMAEETGFIVPLTRWVLDTACAQMMAWRRAGIDVPTVSVNVSPRGFNDCNLPGMVGEVLAATGMDGKCLNIEITESVMMENVQASIETLAQLKKFGLKVSVDDFGTGYSSLSYLKRLPIDTLKIDQSFVRDVRAANDEAAIANLIIAMAHSLNLSVVAEGVETPEQKSFLESRSCDIIQGYLVSKPLPVPEITRFLQQRSGK